MSCQETIVILTERVATSCGRKLFMKKLPPSAKNDDSLVFPVAFRSRSFLLPGDAAANTRLFRTSLPPSSHVSRLFLPAKEILTDILARNSSHACGKLVFPPCAPTPTARLTFQPMGKI